MDWLWNLIVDNLGYITGAVLSLGVIALYLGKLRKLLREIAELLIDFDKAFEDGKVSKEELEIIKKDGLEVWDAVKQFAVKK